VKDRIVKYLGEKTEGNYEVITSENGIKRKEKQRREKKGSEDGDNDSIDVLQIGAKLMYSISNTES
jgi:3-deoxy-D-arabino-heptulosonate 7-phosphate (DAHP) synthase